MLVSLHYINFSVGLRESKVFAAEIFLHSFMPGHENNLYTSTNLKGGSTTYQNFDIWLVSTFIVRISDFLGFKVQSHDPFKSALKKKLNKKSDTLKSHNYKLGFQVIIASYP